MLGLNGNRQPNKMDKENTILLQKIDCNCNDCIHMERNVDEYKRSLDRHYMWQLNHFNTIKNKLIERAKWYKDKFYDLEMWDKLLTQAENMKFQFNRNEAMINYGYCAKLNQFVSFIPNTCQINTQHCFTHRRDNLNKNN